MSTPVLLLTEMKVREGEELPVPFHIFAKNALGQITNYTELAACTVEVWRRLADATTWDSPITCVPVNPGGGVTWAKVTDFVLGIVELYPNDQYWGPKGTEYDLLVKVIPVSSYVIYAPTDTEVRVIVNADRPH